MYDLSDEGSQFHRAGALLTNAYHCLDEAAFHLGRTGQGALALQVDDLRKAVDKARREVERRRQEWMQAERDRRNVYRGATSEQRAAGTLAESQADVSALGNP